ncbi:MAG: hypothetical protein ACKVOK_12565 [Flavobacteriales bacterium]
MNYPIHRLMLKNYSPFGTVLYGRSWSLEFYRYGFQNQEMDAEIWEGSVNFKYRVEDARLGRFFSVDPLISKYPEYSAYSFSGNKVIHAIEIEGCEEHVLSNGETIYGPYSSEYISSLDEAPLEAISENSKDGWKDRNWTYTFDLNFFNIDYGPDQNSYLRNSWSGPYSFNGNEIDMQSNFTSYSSWQNTGGKWLGGGSQMGDQMGTYLLTIVDEDKGYLISLGGLHDKRSQDDAGQTLKLVKGGKEATLMVGYQMRQQDNSFVEGGWSGQIKLGAYVGYNDVDINLKDNQGNTYTDDDKYGYSGWGGVALFVATYSHNLTESRALSFRIQGMVMQGTLTSPVLKNGVESGTFSTPYGGFTLGIGLNYSWNR